VQPHTSACRSTHRLWPQPGSARTYLWVQGRHELQAAQQQLRCLWLARQQALVEAQHTQRGSGHQRAVDLGAVCVCVLVCVCVWVRACVCVDGEVEGIKGGGGEKGVRAHRGVGR
jgi:hypothetical protein